MRIFGPLPWPTISPVTVTLARSAAALVTVSPSTSRIAGRVTVSPASPARRLTVNRSPTATLCWLPPAFTTAYTTDSSFASFVVQLRVPRTIRFGAGCWTDRTRLRGGTRRCAAGAVQPDQRTRGAPTGSTGSGDRWARRAAGRAAAPRARHRVDLRDQVLGLGLGGHRDGLARELGRVHDLGDLGDGLVARGRLLGRDGVGADLDGRLVLEGGGEDGDVLGHPVLPRLPAVAPAAVASAAAGTHDLAVLVGRRAVGRGVVGLHALLGGRALGAAPVVPGAAVAAAAPATPAALVDRVGVQE